jgi:D-alanyl-D-alanine carboxypeptidase (penicillin-binding protein 5/6)
MSLHDALELMLVTSASNYAEAVSTWAFGSQARFRTAASDWLARNGLTGTTIVEPVGLDPRNTSTMRDLIALAKLALASPVVAQIVALPSTDVPGFTGLPNTNTQLGVSGIDGIKTGTLEEAGSCLLFSAVVDVGLSRPIRIVGIVLGAFDHSSAGLAAVAMINSVTGGFHQIPVIDAGDVVGTYTTPWGEKANVRAAQSARILTWSDTAIAAKASAVPVGAAERRTDVGSATFTGGKRDVTVPLYLSEEITGPDAWWRITHPVELFGG